MKKSMYGVSGIANNAAANNYLFNPAQGKDSRAVTSLFLKQLAA